ncbi:MAG: V-type ATPase subunit, partial [Planctomycetota bacterium]
MDYEQRTAVLDFYTYPPVGTDDWRYVFQSAQVRAIELLMLTRAAFLDMANAENFQAAVNLLSATEYAMPRDYSPDGNFPPEQFENVFAEENYTDFPDYMADASERAVLAYYRNKDIRQIDHTIDSAQAEYNLKQAHRLNSIFLLSLFRTQIDLTNIRTMLRLKFTESEQRNIFLKGGFIELERLERGAEIGYEALAQLFFVTPYYHLIEAGAAYLTSEKSFLKIEQQC